MTFKEHGSHNPTVVCLSMVIKCEGFTVDDAFARREMHKFYALEDGWRRERLYSPDI